MKTLLFILAIVLMASGFAVGLMNMFSPGTVTVGLNYDVAATLFTGGCLLLGLGVLAGSVASRGDVEEDEPAPSERGNGKAPARSRDADLPEFMAPVTGGATAAAGAAGAIAAGAAGAVASGAGKAWDFGAVSVEKAKTAVTDTAESAAETVSETAHAAVEAAGSATAAVKDDLSSLFDQAADKAEAAAETVSESVETVEEAVEQAADEAAHEAGEAVEVVTGTAEEAVDSVEEFAAGAVEQVEETAGEAGEWAGEAAAEADAMAEEAAGEIEAMADEAVADEAVPDEPLEQEEALFVVEERTIRDRPARLLSDGTVEAETDEGWMRFENVEHVEEYLDAMKATA